MLDIKVQGFLGLCLLVLWLLEEFSDSANCRGWLSSWRIKPLLVLIAGLLPALEHGAWWAWLCGYVLLSLVLLSTVSQYLISLIPGNFVTLKSPQSHRTGRELLSLLGMGLLACLVFVKNVLWTSAVILSELIVAVAMLVLALLNPTRRLLALPPSKCVQLN